MTSLEMALEYIKINNVKFLRFQFVDIHGEPKNIAYPVKLGTADGEEELLGVLENGLFFDGSSIEGFVEIEDSDMVLKPDLSTLSVLPWRPSEKSVARIICDVYRKNGKPFEGDPRGCLKRVLGEFKEEFKGEYFVGPEPEFFILKNENGKWVPGDNAGYFDLEPVDEGNDLRRNIVFALENLGFHVEASHHEVADGQHEVDFKYDNAVRTADSVVTFKTTIKTLAKQSGSVATFMPKPFFGINGSGMHCNQSIWLDGKPSFYDENNPYQLSDICLSYIGGILEHTKSLVSITNPTVNSYKRLVPGYEAPVNIAWANSNRSSIIRVPAARGKGTRVEFRAPDPTCNPYLAFTVMLAAGLDGVRKKLIAPEPVEENIFAMSEAQKRDANIASVPSNLCEAIEELKQDKVLKKALGDHIFNKFIEIKTQEWDSYRTAVTDWEFNKYVKF
ncbi:type I glutamate--ammonia ligase [Methanococcus voltae]|uniref:Glutamine synthetase n=1 Tax=Methanococcus voltae (strain ATCC BAA-1334 / A3) TaxID=456320 RepID=D7DTM9_METV3|nr:type I glutamate--ammonia ligase [Methanococcus voltae]MCS3901343.1 glutamine synthetase [Methanococcus voltae]